MINDVTQVQAHNGPLFYVRSTPGGSDAIVLREMFEENVYRLTPDDCHGTIVDIGANIGAFSVYAALHGATRVIAVEPEPENAELLRRNIVGYPAISQRTIAMWSADGSVQIIPSQGATRVTPDGPLVVSALRLSTLFEQERLGAVTTLKMDTEGSEYPIIDATPTTLLATIRYIAIEFHITDAATFGALVAKLSLTHAVQTLGSYERGGYLYCRRYA